MGLALPLIGDIGVVGRHDVVPVSLNALTNVIPPVAVLHMDVQLTLAALGIHVVIIRGPRHTVIAHRVPHAHQRLTLQRLRTRLRVNCLIVRILIGLTPAHLAAINHRAHHVARIDTYGVVLHRLAVHSRHVLGSNHDVVGVVVLTPAIIHAEGLHIHRIGCARSRASLEMVNVEDAVVRACLAGCLVILRIVPRSHHHAVIPCTVSIVGKHMQRKVHVDLVTARCIRICI